MTKVNDLLERRAEGWESDSEEAGEGLYYTEKQTRVFKAIVRNRDANLKEVAEEAGVHPSYVRYIVNRLPKDKATDIEWLMDKAGVDEEELEEEEKVEGEPPALSEEEQQAREEKQAEEQGQETHGEEALKQSFGVGGGGGASEEEVQTHAGEDGYQVTMTRMLPVTISVNIPQDALEAEVSEAVEEATNQFAKQANQINSD